MESDISGAKWQFRLLYALTIRRISVVEWSYKRCDDKRTRAVERCYKREKKSSAISEDLGLQGKLHKEGISN